MRWRGFGGRAAAGLVAAMLVSLVVGAASASADSTGAISGTATDAVTHEPIEGIHVCAEGADNFELGCMNTLSDGSYEIVDLAPGTYSVHFFGSSVYVGQYVNPVQVTAGTTLAGIDAALQTGGTIAGTVTDAITHAPMGEVTVCVRPYPEHPSSCVWTEPDGTYEITGLEPDSYTVNFYQASAGDLDSSSNYLPQYYNDKRDESEAEPVSVTMGHVTTGIDAAMHEGGIISGLVTDAITSDPLPYAWVCASHYEEEEHDPLTDRCTEAGADGSYLIAGLSAGDYAIYIDHVPAGPLGAGKLNYAPQFYNDKTNFATSTPFHVTEQQTFPGINFAMHAGATISGTIVDAETHQPVPDVVVSLWPVEHGDWSDYPAFGYDQTSDGHFMIVGFPSGEFTLRMETFGSSEGIYPRQFLSGKATAEEGAEQFSLTVGHDTTLGNVELFKELGGSEPEEGEEQEPSNPGPGSGGGSSTPAPSNNQSPPRRQAPAPSHKHPASSADGTAFAGRVAVANGNTVLLPVRCGSNAACRGIAKLVAEVQPRGRAGQQNRVGRRAQKIVFGKSRFSVAAGRRATIRIKLNGKGKQLLRDAGKKGVKAKVSGTGIKPRSLILKSSPPPKKHRQS